MGSSHSLSHRELVSVCRYLVGIEFGGDDCDEVLEHLVICSKKEKLKGSNSALTTLSLSQCPSEAVDPLLLLEKKAMTYC